jgi:methionyl-tRNA formyltransferase
VVADGLVFLAADTTRSRAYAQALVAHGVAPERTLILGRPDANPTPSGAAPTESASLGDLFVPNLEETLGRTVERAGWCHERVDLRTVNDAQVVAWLAAAEARLAVYSGFGGQIVGPEVLRAGTPLLHLHSGWLPAFRGSTTLYYALLVTRRCHVTALLLSERIDEGPIVARREYDAPPSDVDIDSLYDGAIRADLLVRTIDAWQRAGGVLESVRQARDEGETYYVIHPVLKHLAVMSLDRSPRPGRQSSSRSSGSS